MRRFQRILLPCVLLAIGVWLLVGCIYIPTFNMTTGGKDATKYVGEADSKKLRPGVSTRDNVRRVLGKPFFQTSDGRFLVYSWKKQKGLVVYPFCFAATPEAKAFAMTFEFGDDGLLRTFDLESRRGWGYLTDPPNAKRFVPDRVNLHETGLKVAREHPERLDEFRAATQRIRQPAPKGD